MKLPMDTKFEAWLDTHRHHYTDFSLAYSASIVKAQRLKVVVIIPAKEVASTIAGVLRETVRPLITAGVVSSIIVIDANSVDKTGEVAAKHGATVIQRADIAPELGSSQGKGDALWRALKVTDGDIIAFLDGDTRDPNTAHLLGILGPLLLNDKIHMVRGCFDRPFTTPSGELQTNEGGRVTELTARPLLNLHFPQLAGFRQPLAGEFAARRSLLEKLKFPVGYGIEIGTLIDAWRLVGLRGLAEVDLGTRQNAHKPLRDLASMSHAVMSTVERRCGRQVLGRIWLPWQGQYQDVPTNERPPLVQYSNGTKKMEHHHRLTNGTGPKRTNNVPGVGNFRDIGGYTEFPASCIRRGLVFRSADPSALTTEGKAKLQAFGIRKVFDLRRTEEITNYAAKESVYETWLSSACGPDRSIIPVFQDDDFAPEALARRLLGYADETTKGPVEVYRSILVKSREALRAIFSYLCSTDSPEPFLINCTAGKDRTGIVIMVLMLLAGSSAEDVAKEYHRSEEGLGPDWKTRTIERMIMDPSFAGQDRRAVERLVGAREEVMMDVIALIEKEWGGIEGFVREEMQVSDWVLHKSKGALRA